ncbi:MAG TPA: PilT/PilU family type 4a pilus ATPase [Candidatus Woesebacteria bacterium]|nr:PilT/PilU family type 4a pilus ATPase [Candidatus Woesebacteria bacterium]
MDQTIRQLLIMAGANKASDVHLFSSVLPKFRVNGELIEVANFEIGRSDEMSQKILSILNPEQIKKFELEKEIDFSLAVDETRFRVNIYYQKGEVAAALRVVPSEIRSFEQLGLPKIVSEFVNLKQGFVLITGPTGQGKSTTVSSILNEINRTRKTHIVTVEDPIEYIIKPEKSMISQRELGFDTLSFNSALRSVLRQDPNVVFIGEMRDLETIQSALTIAETGHLVFSTLHTNSAAQTIDRIIDVFPEGAKEQIRMQLSTVISAIVSQRLVQTLDGGRLPAVEVLVANSAVKNNIREGKSFMIDNIIQTSADAGMITLEGSLARLVNQGLVSEEVAMSHALKPTEFTNKLRSIKGI